MTDLTGSVLGLNDLATIAAGETLQYLGASDPSGGIVTDQQTVVSSTAAPGVLEIGDSVSVDGTALSVAAIEIYSASIDYDNGAANATAVPFAVVTLDDGTIIGMILDPSQAYGNVSGITLDSLMSNGPIAETDAALTGVGIDMSWAPDGVIDGSDGDDAMNNGYVDGDGDMLDNSGQQIFANGGNDTVLAGLGDDTIDGGSGEDWLFGRDGDDSMDGGADNDTLWGDGGNDTLYGNTGDDKLIGGAGDDLVIGGAGDDLLIGDDNPGDHGGWSESDTPEPGYGSDTLVLDDGNDTALGGSGDDEFRIFDGFGDHVIVGGEAGETDGDRIDASAITENVNVTYTGDESGRIENGTNSTEFDEIENLYLGSGDDTVEVLTSTTGFVNGGDGFDTLVLPDPAPGDPAPEVTITSSVDNGDGTTTYGGYVVFPDGSRMEFENFEEIICFTPGTLIDTARGRVKVEDLVPGDRVLTRDHGYQPLAWVGRRDLTAAELAACPAAAPVRISAGALGAGLPERDMRVSPRHRMLITGARAELMFGEREVLVCAADLLGLPGVTQDLGAGVSYIHIMCDAHQIIRAEGAWTESFQPAAGVIGALDMATRDELLGLFPELATERGQSAFVAARPVLSGAEARELFAA